MTDPWAELVDGPSPRDPFGDLEEIARPAFEVRLDGSEFTWAEHAWRAIGGAGLLAARSETERAVTVLRMVALSVFYREFAARAFGEGGPGEWEIDPDLAVGDYPRIHPVLLGALAERRGISIDSGIDEDYEHGATAVALDGLVRSEYRTVVDVVRRAEARNVVWASLWRTSEPDVVYPLDGAAVTDVDDADITVEMQMARVWLESGAVLR
ncbi:MAG: hypothetical protein OJJ54_00375 [Pseudonocardia sp.]|nr:hypothetical protein [Pseudonocardia sp.]